MIDQLRTHSFKHGTMSCTVLEEGSFNVVLESEFEESKKEALIAALSQEDTVLNEVEIGFNYLLLDDGTSKILIDSGKGNGKLVSALSIVNLSPEDIDYLVITHGDNDHMGGIHHFPNSKIVMSKKAYDMWTSDAARSILIQEAYDALVRIFPEDMMQLSNQSKIIYGAETLPSLLPRLILVRDDEEFIPGLKMFATPGHRGDHYSLEVISGDRKMILLGDAVRYAFQLDNPELSSLFDSHAEEWTQSIKLINERDPRKNALYFGTHITFPGLFSRK